VTGAALIVAIGIMVPIAFSHVPEDTRSHPDRDSHPSIINPDEWTGKTFPWMSDIQFNSSVNDLMVGRWTLIFYNQECSDCQESVPELLRTVLSDSLSRVALVEVPPYGHRIELPAAMWPKDVSRVSFCRLRETRDWFVRTPSLMALRDGIGIPLNRDLASRNP
jgi:hypothetical protein